MIDIINKTREYLDYIEEHYNNVQKAFRNITSGEYSKQASRMGFLHKFQYDDFYYGILSEMVKKHDISKMSHAEFTPYRRAFFPTDKEPKIELNEEAWEHHKNNNNHHWQSWIKINDNNERYLEAVHNFIDWYAMSIKFGGKPLDYYEKNKQKIDIPEWAEILFYEIQAVLEAIGEV